MSFTNLTQSHIKNENKEIKDPHQLEKKLYLTVSTLSVYKAFPFDYRQSP